MLFIKRETWVYDNSVNQADVSITVLHIFRTVKEKETALSGISKRPSVQRKSKVGGGRGGVCLHCTGAVQLLM